MFSDVILRRLLRLCVTFTNRPHTFVVSHVLCLVPFDRVMTYRSSTLRLACLILTGSLLAIVGSSCSSSRPSEPTDDGPSSQRLSGPALSLLYTTADTGLVLHDARRDEAQSLVAEAEFTGNRAVSPTGRYLAFSYATADSSHLALLDLETQNLQHVHAVAERGTYSLAWPPDSHGDRLAFGHYRSTENGDRGPGGIHVTAPGETPRNIGCRTVREVLHWLPNGRLATRTEDNLYVVAVEDCATLTSRDARRMHHVRYAPDGRQMAYIHRELTYDRSAGEYVPDSSLVVSGPQGENAETLFGNERRVRHHRWAPEASDLALDVHPPESDHRQIVVYNGTRTVFLVPPDQTTADQVHPRWSPSGNRIAFTLQTEDGARAAVRVKGQTRRLGPTTGPIWGWLDERSVVVPGPDSVRVQTLNGTTRYTHPTPAQLIYVWSRPVS